MSTSTSTSARRTGTDGARRTTVRPRCQARARATRSGNDAKAVGTGGSAVGLSAASRATVVIPAARSAVAASPRTTRLTSCSRASSVSQVGHGQRRHSMTRDGGRVRERPWRRRSRRRPGRRSGRRTPRACCVGRASARRRGRARPRQPRPARPPRRAGQGLPGPRGPAGVLQHPAQVGQAHQVPRLGAGLARRVRGGLPGVRLGQGRGEGAAARVRDAVPHDDHRHVPAAGQRTSSSAPPRRAPPGSPGRRTAHPGEPGGPGGAVEIDWGRSAPQISGAPAAIAAAVAATRSGASADTARHPRRPRVPAAPHPHAVLRGVGQTLRRRRVGQRLRTRDRGRVVVEVDSPAAVRGGRGVEHDPAGPAPGTCAGTWSAVAVTVRSV